jgi:hypothetical protein
LITGDFITARKNDALDYPKYIEILKSLSNTVETYACLGNHDGGVWSDEHEGFSDTDFVSILLQKSNIKLLDNEIKAVSVLGQKIKLCGFGDLWANRFDTSLIKELSRSEFPTIVLSHNPDTKNLLKDGKWDLLLCGHTHGGQIRIPMIGAPFAPVVDHRYIAGLYQWSDRQIYINRGLGSFRNFRLNCMPEVAILDLF